MKFEEFFYMAVILGNYSFKIHMTANRKTGKTFRDETFATIRKKSDNEAAS